jgi:hypothetical protein
MPDSVHQEGRQLRIVPSQKQEPRAIDLDEGLNSVEVDFFDLQERDGLDLEPLSPEALLPRNPVARGTHKLARKIPKNQKGFTSLKLEHFFLLGLGIALFATADTYYHEASPVLQVIFLIFYLGSLVGISPIPMPAFKSNFKMLFFAGVSSGLLDSYIVLDQCRKLKTVEDGQDEAEIMAIEGLQLIEGVRSKLIYLMTQAALIGGLIIWFGEVFAAPVYNYDGRTGLLSALYIVPPVFLFLTILGLFANRLPIKVIPRIPTPWERQQRVRNFLEFAIGITMLLVTHNALMCLGLLMIYTSITRQDDNLLSNWKHHTEVSVMLVLFLALTVGDYAMTMLIEPLGLASGEFAPLIPSAIQAVFFGALYDDPTTHLWIKITLASTGAQLTPVSSLVGVMVATTKQNWKDYMKYSVPSAILWFTIMRTYIYFTLETPFGNWLDHWAHAKGLW